MTSTLRYSSRAQALLVRPPAMPAPGRVRDQLLAMRAALDEELAAADERLCRALAHRAEVAGRLAACNRALVGTGVRLFPDGTSQRIGFPPPLDWSDPLDAVAPGARPLPTADLRRRLVDLLEVAGQPLTTTDLRRLLAASGWCTVGDAPKDIANALRSPVGRGVVRRVGRGRYRWVGDQPARPSSRVP
jgi:hypothetical protein